MKLPSLFAFAALAALSAAQADFRGAYSQNFDTLDNLGALANGTRSVWRNDQTLDGWYSNIPQTASINGVPLREQTYYVLNDPSSTSTKSRVIGSVGRQIDQPNSGDRALSFTGTVQDEDGPVLGPLYVGLRLCNTTGATIDAIDLSYYGEVWSYPRSDFGELSTQTVVDFRTGGTGLEDVGYTAAPSLGFVNPPKPFLGQLIDGNLPENRTLVEGRLSGLGWAAGDDLWIRFRTPFSGKGELGLSAIDDLRIAVAPVPEPATYLVLGGALAAFRRRRK